MGDFIKDYWDSQAKKHDESPLVSWGDQHMIDLEIEVVAEHIESSNSILDIGCSNGHATFQQLANNKSIEITGIDYSEEMIERANKRKKKESIERINFAVGDIREIDFEDNMFDLVYTTRVLINLPNWEQQKKSILEGVRVTKKGGKLILSEAFWEPLSKLNALRIIENLPPLVEHDFNRYLKKDRLENFLNEQGLKFKVNNFSSLYYLGTRFIRELATVPSDYPGFTNPINEDFFLLEKKYSGGSFGVQQAYIIEL